MVEYFDVAGDLDNDISFESNYYSDDDINKYLSNIVSGIEYSFECEYGTLCSEGKVLINFKKLQDMVEEGSYNIIDAKCYSKDMIEVRFQKFQKNSQKSK